MKSKFEQYLKYLLWKLKEIFLNIYRKETKGKKSRRNTESSWILQILE